MIVKISIYNREAVERAEQLGLEKVDDTIFVDGAIDMTEVKAWYIDPEDCVVVYTLNTSFTIKKTEAVMAMLKGVTKVFQEREERYI